MTDLLPAVIDIARRAGAVVMDIYRGMPRVRRKADATPVTDADEASETLIVAALRALTPDVTVIAEEESAAGNMPEAGSRFWLVDPLDGTKEFIARSDEFSINIALIEARRPVLGVVFVPALDRLYAACGDKGTVTVNGAARSLRARSAPPAGMTVLSSRSHGNSERLKAYLSEIPVVSTRLVGSAYKFGIVAEGEADLYVRFGPTMEWDTAAGHAVLNAAGGRVETIEGAELVYGKPGYLNPAFVARGRE